ncbi:MAG: carbamoyltransferase HypF [Promethearchaeota archaeon]|nr:MAG: carbamoyltransferase HypF [Candidatus Lokiarchaeota archaeon]
MKMKEEREKIVEINITGIVQGVGFRPFLFNLARAHNLKGYVLNRGNAGVRLVIQGKGQQIKHFIREIDLKKPQISYIENLEQREIDREIQFDELKIKKSEKGRGISLTLPPDVSICDKCLEDMRNKELSRYFEYPFIACAQCGPRFTTVTALPYDRKRSTMKQFPFCDGCLDEYTDFDNRRFHAQTFACSRCGPNYRLYDKNGRLLKTETISEILQETATRLKEGNIAAVKGIGGVHLVCLATDDEVIKKLRKRKRKRRYKPFALMIPNMEVIDNYFNISEKEREIITSFRKPIVLLEKNKSFFQSNISEMVAPGLNNIGFMLPYTGIHYLIFKYMGNDPLIYTSGNKSGLPMGIENDTIINHLEGIADFFLLHDRTIHQRADDSVLRVHDNQMKIIRRSRGFVPEYIPLPFPVEVPGALATGPELNVTGAVLRRNRIFPSQHIGNTTNLETFEFLKNGLNHMKTLLQIKDSEIKFIASDAHPSFITSQYAKELSSEFSVPSYPIQHHYAHILGLMAENGIKEDQQIIGISTDGVGFGDDGNIWGGEILRCSYDEYERVGHLQYQPMVGGDRCTKYPARMLASILLNSLDENEVDSTFEKLQLENDLEYQSKELEALKKQYKDGKYPLSSSTGRIFDAVSYILGTCSLKTYRGEPAMRLEGMASKGNAKKIHLKVSSYDENGISIINTSKLILDILELESKNIFKKRDIAAKFQKSLGKKFAEIAINKAKKFGIKKIGVSGGVAYNYAFSQSIKNLVTSKGFTFLEHNTIPPGDAGISIGQLIGGLFKYCKEFNNL